jgi:hypothetical protein
VTAVTVRRTRIRDARGDALAAQLRVARLLAAADVSTGLHRGSLLLVRRLADPLPGTLASEPHALRPPAAWERALRESLLEIARSAARPALGFVPAGARAVYFADEAELLACLARDLADGTAGTSWWWALAEPRRPLEPRVTLEHALVEHAAAVPAAFERLLAAGTLAQVVAMLDTDAAHAVARAVAARFGVALLEPQAARERPDRPVEVEGSPLAGAKTQRELLASIAAVAPEAVALDAPAETRELVALALVLRRATAVAHASAFASALRAAAAAEPTQTVLPARRTAPSQPWLETTMKPRSIAMPRRVVTPSTAHVDSAARPTSVALPDGPASTDVPVAAPEPELVPIPVAEVDAPTTIATELGGVLFLVNVGIALGLYADFTSPGRTGIGLDFWRFLSLLGGRLLARRPARRDAVWQLLRDLARPDAPRFRPPSRPPRAWTTALTPRDRALLERAKGDPLDRWIAQVAVCVRARLRGAGVEVGALLRRPARVEVAETRVDATFELACHPVEVRLAGLDRDPGFVPAAGRTIAFHFR